MTWRYDDAHTRRILAPKNKPVEDRLVLEEFARSHWYCQACGRPESSSVALTIHHIIGGRGGRSDEFCNLLRVCWFPCHMLFEGHHVLRKDWITRGEGHDPYLPIMCYMVAMAMKERVGELTGEGYRRLEALHGKNFPEPVPIPEPFVELFRKNRPELHP